MTFTERQVSGGAIGIVGFALVVVNAGWLVAIGLLLAMWSNNILYGSRS